MTEWVVGAEVVERTATWGPTYRYGVPRKIEKVYKNGNFVLDGDDRQWRPVVGYARRTGDSGYGSSHTALVPLTDEVRDDMRKADEYGKAAAVVRAEAERLDKIWRGKDVDEVIAAANTIRSSA